MAAPTRQVIVTADDFGLDVAVNEAVEQAYRYGVLTTASLMVGQPATADAVRRARRLPGLAVGLHLALTNAEAVADSREIPHLLEEARLLRRDLLGAAIAWCRPSVQTELRRELRAQFAAFRRTGLSLDHVSVHQHMHLHPILLRWLLAECTPGLPAIRWPNEPVATLRALRLLPPPWERWRNQLLIAYMRRHLDRRGITHADQVFGIRLSGHFHEEHFLRLLAVLPPGLTECYFHPATRKTASLAFFQPGHDGPAELQALLSPRVQETIRRLDIHLTTYTALCRRRA